MDENYRESSVVLLIDPDAASRNYISVLLQKSGYSILATGSGREGLIIAWRDLPSVIIFDPALPDIDAVSLLTRLRQDRRTEEVPCIAMSSSSNPQEVNDLLAAGCNEYLVKSNQAMSQIIELMPRLLSKEVVEEKKGKVIVFMSAKGGTGTSSLCANIAMNLGRIQPESRVVVMDLVLPIGSIASIIGYYDRLNIISMALEGREKISPQALRDELPAFPVWNFQLLAGSPDPESANMLEPGQAFGILKTVQAAFDFVFIDLGRSLSRFFMPIILRADVIPLILGVDHLTVALTKSVLEHLKAKGVDHRRLYPIINRAVGLEGMSKTEVENTLDLKIRAAMPYLSDSFTLANNRHEPVIRRLIGDSSEMAITTIAREIAELAESLQEKPS
ncbi:MAG: response regulator [Chloroflexota bacterium]